MKSPASRWHLSAFPLNVERHSRSLTALCLLGFVLTISDALPGRAGASTDPPPAALARVLAPGETDEQMAIEVTRVTLEDLNPEPAPASEATPEAEQAPVMPDWAAAAASASIASPPAPVAVVRQSPAAPSAPASARQSQPAVQPPAQQSAPVVQSQPAPAAPPPPVVAAAVVQPAAPVVAAPPPPAPVAAAVGFSSREQLLFAAMNEQRTAAGVTP